MARRVDRTPGGTGRRRIGLHVSAAFAVLLLAGVTYGISAAIESHHDRIVLKGLDGKPAPLIVIVADKPLIIPANLIRFRTDRRGGVVTAVDLLLHWPSLDGFSEERAEDFRDVSPKAPLIYVTITEAETPLDSTARLATIYSRYFTGPPIAGAGHLVGRNLEPDSGYRGEIVYFEPRVSDPYVVRCLAEETEEIPATCMREVNIGQGLTMLYRFNRAWLADWRTMDDRLGRLVNQFFPRRVSAYSRSISRMAMVKL